jgi:hypothetical protein
MPSVAENFGDAFYAAMLAAWQAQGPAVIERLRRDNPAEYLRLVVSVLPRWVSIDEDSMDISTDGDLEALRAFLATLQDRHGDESA